MDVGVTFLKILNPKNGFKCKKFALGAKKPTMKIEKFSVNMAQNVNIT